MLSQVLLVVILMSISHMANSLMIEGRHAQLDYNECGLWNNPFTSKGFVMDDCCPVEMTSPGSPWQLLVVSYYAHGVYYEFKGNAAYGPNFCTYKVIETTVLDDGSGKMIVRHRFDMKHIILTKKETWNFRDHTVVVEFTAKYPNDRCKCKAVENLRVMHAVDPDQDRNPFYTFSTINDVIYPGGQKHYAEAVGPVSCNTMAYGICGQRSNADFTEEVGFSYWDSSPFAYLFDPNSVSGDLTLHYRHIRKSLDCDKSTSFRFVVTWAASAKEARTNYQSAYKKLCCCANISFSAPQHLSGPCQKICPCDGEDSGCTCKNKIDNSNFTFPAIDKWLPFFHSHVVRRDVSIGDKGTDPTTAPTTAPIASMMDIALASLASAADRFNRTGGMPTFELDEEIAFVRILDDLPKDCPHMGELSTLFLSSVNTTNIQEVYDDYTVKCIDTQS